MDEQSLDGTWVYDDGGTIKENVVVRRPRSPVEASEWVGNQSALTDLSLLLEEAMQELAIIGEADFWGQALRSPRSHKSFRPITTLTYRINYLLNGDNLFWYHVVNRVLHIVVTGLATILTHIALESADGFPALVGGLLFAVHPIHGEAVCNLTGRAELLMAFFYLFGVLIYYQSLQISPNKLHTIKASLLTIVVPLFCAWCALLSKETGVVVPITCVVCDFCRLKATIPSVLTALLPQKHKNGSSHKEQEQPSVSLKSRNDVSEERNDNEDLGETKTKVGASSNVESSLGLASSTQALQRCSLRWFIFRSFLLALGTIIIGIWRLSLNGEGKPNLIVDQNPAAFAEDTFTRVMSVNYVYYSYMESFVWPMWLAPDWSGPSIPLIESSSDMRIALVVVFWIWLYGSLGFSLLTLKSDQSRRAILQSVLGYTVAPFFLAANVVVVTGTMKAERVVYLPSLGPCMLTAHLVDLLSRKAGRRTGDPPQALLQVLLTVVLLALSFRSAERAHAWTNSYNLWESAIEVNDRSWHTWYNYGVQLVRHNQPEKAESLFRKVLIARPKDYANRYVLGIVLRATNRCEEAVALADESIAMLDVKSADDNELRLNRRSDKAFMLTLKSQCAKTIAEMSILAQEAIVTDPGNTAAIERVKELSELATSLGLGSKS